MAVRGWKRWGGRSGSLTGRDWGGNCSGDSIGGKRPRRLNLDDHRCEAGGAGEAGEACDLTTSSEMTSQSDMKLVLQKTGATENRAYGVQMASINC